jgi:hypothetical protein
VIPVPAQTQAVADSPILTMSATCSIAGCTFNISGVPSPCLTVQWVQGATSVQAGGDFALNESSVGLCLAATQAPQGTVLIVAAQPVAAGV